MLTLSVNGDLVTLSEAIDLRLLLEQQGYQSQKIAVAVNGEFVPRSQYAERVVHQGDLVDVIQAVGGG